MSEVRKQIFANDVGIWSLDDFHHVVRAKRLREGISIRELARRCEVSPTTIQLLEQGSNVRLFTIATVAQHLDIIVTVDANSDISSLEVEEQQEDNKC